MTKVTVNAAALERRREAAARYKPDRIRILLVAEAPPADLSRYFYFEDVGTHDSLFRYVFRTVTNRQPVRESKAKDLAELKAAGVFLIDLKETPVDGSPLTGYVPSLVERCTALAGERIILIKVSVFDAAFEALKAAGLPVVDGRIPFPGSSQQLRFVAAFEAALGIRK